MTTPGFPQSIALRGSRHAELARVTPADAAAVLAHYERAAGETDFMAFGPGELGRGVEEQAELLGALQAPEVGLALKGVVDGELAALVVIKRLTRPRVHHVGELGLSVLKAYWFLGLGRALCEAAIMAARPTGLTRVELRTRQDNARAISLYEDLGFRVEGRLPGAFRVGDVEHDDVLMGLRLHNGTLPPPGG
ncbi:MAG TPA: GNAT family N-acetyltransferase [Polyangiaceae bacterium]